LETLAHWSRSGRIHTGETTPTPSPEDCAEDTAERDPWRGQGPGGGGGGGGGGWNIISN